MPPIDVHLLTDGGQRSADIAGVVASFLAGAQHSLDIALYGFDLHPETAAPIIDAMHAAEARGAQVRLIYNIDQRNPIPVPPPPRTDLDAIAATGAEVKPVSGIPDLMHHKYVVRDGTAVLSGSTNWTEDSWTREENIMLSVENPDVASAFAKDFEDLWTHGVPGSGELDDTPVTVGTSEVHVHFCPGRARRLVRRITGAIGRAERRIRVASPVITSGPILGALAEVSAGDRVDLAGVYDRTQMREVFGQWRENGFSSWKIPCFEAMVKHSPFGSKVTTPYAPGSIHDYMHAKICVADDVVFVGSYNLSHSGEENAENVLEIVDAGLADRLATFIDQIRTRYPSD